MASAPPYAGLETGAAGGGMPTWLMALAPILAGILGGGSTTNSTGSTTGTTSGFSGGSSLSNSSTTFNNLLNALTSFQQSPTITPEFANLGSLVRNFAERRMTQGNALPPGYEATQLVNINKGFDAAKAQADQRAAESGLSGSPGALALGDQIEQARAGAGNEFRAQVPLLERQLGNENAGLASNILNMFGKGVSGTSSTSQEGSGSSNTLAQSLFQQLFGSNTAGTSQQQTQQNSGLCCWIFLEGKSGLDPSVRRYRDEHMTPRNRRGYYKVAEVLIPLMRRYSLMALGVKLLMVDPLTSYGKWFYTRKGIGWVFTPLKTFWLDMFDYLGGDHPFQRVNGEVV